MAITSNALQFLLHLIERAVCAFLDVLARSLSILDVASAWTFEVLCGGLGVQPCGTAKPEHGAVLVLGAQEGLGRSLALKFSEQGYTVFAFCPFRHEEAGRAADAHASGHVAPPNMSSLLYMWHNRKERSRPLPWGLIAPMSLDVFSRSQRERAHETVKAYCDDHALALVALIVCPIPERSRNSPSKLFLHSLIRKPLPAHQTYDVFEDTWRKCVLAGITEPTLVAYDYTGLLRKAFGRVIVVSSGSGVFDLSFPIQDARAAVVENLRDNLQPFGVHVSAVVTGPLASTQIETRGSKNESSQLEFCLDDRDMAAAINRMTKVQQINQRITDRLRVSEDRVVSVIQRAVESPHPQFSYYIGAQPIVRCIYMKMPIFMRTAIQHVLYRVASLS
ncbi:hypothetical protein FA95DRAFT_1555169 [Auriscalpium vulgare]|uniref:Uncharacterized protein n=1 Tax=Auriscalpium vulgare TaxID=40419 RepID=A0ACB8S2Z8_9AGAM|nr:hypothetical protein FA95DRAFT_1555169 [Auriscalpium vulgare]